MTIIRDEKDEKLRFGIGSQGGERQSGVCIAMFDKIPVGSRVFAQLDVPTELTTNMVATLAPGAILPSLPAQGFIFEHAPEPPAYTVGGVSVRGRQRMLVTNGLGKMTPAQAEPDWAVFAPSVTGALVQKGKFTATFDTPGTTALTPNLKPADRHLVRLRWLGVAVLTGALPAATGAKQTITFQFIDALANPVRNIVPGSVVVHFTAAAAPAKLRDDGRSRIVGIGAPVAGNVAAGDGTIDYLAGTMTFTLQAGAADVAAMTVDYEHSCLYQPIDAHLEWDALMAQ